MNVVHLINIYVQASNGGSSKQTLIHEIFKKILAHNPSKIFSPRACPPVIGQTVTERFGLTAG
jgi:hypothetical protein